MISLVNLLKEVTSSPKAIFLAGPAGSGKSYISKQLIPSSLTVINVDDTYEELLKKSGLGMAQKDFGPDELSQAAKLMGQAQKITKEKYAELTKDLKDVVIDGTGAASKPLLKKKEELEALGYKTFMLAIYVSPITSLERNLERERNLLPSIVLRTWRDYNRNISIYREAFGNNFALINNNPENAKTDFNPEEIKRKFFDTTKSSGKPKTPEEQAKSAQEKEQLNQDIKDLVQVQNEFDTIDQAKTKINTFLQS
jgi:dephospho-CoA kinase